MNKSGLSFDELKDKVYDDIKFLAFLEKEFADELKPESNHEGCLKILFTGLSKITKIAFPYALRKARETRKIEELSNQASELLARSHIKEMLCKYLDASVTLPIDVANVISPLLYEIAEKEEFPFDTMLWALISKKIADRGVSDFCN